MNYRGRGGGSNLTCTFFSLPFNEQPIVIPDCQSHDDGALAKEYERSCQLPVPSYLKYNQGADYARKYQDDLLQEYEVSGIIMLMFCT